jgi:hypothetical protein
MNYKDLNKYNMYLAVKSVCDSHAAIWQDLPAFAATCTDFLTCVEAIRTLNQIQTQITTGIAANKRRLRREMCHLALEIAAAIRAWAVSTRNNELAGKVNYSFTTLWTGPATASANRCQNIHALATEHLASLGDHGITAQKLQRLQDSIDAYTAIIQKPRTARVENKTITARIKTEIRAASQLLREGLDRLILQFRVTAPAFVADYQNARIIVDNPATRQSRKSTAADANATTTAPPLAA